MTETTDTQANTQDQTTPTADNISGLNINDLSTLRNIIDLASSRGAFKTTEMTVVGAAYNKLNSFLEDVAKQVANQNTNPESENITVSEQV